MDPELTTIMAPLQHKIFCIKCSEFPRFVTYILFDSDHLSILINRHDLAIDTEISGSLTNFFKLLKKDQHIPLSSLDIKVYGDVAAAQNLEIFIKKLNIDWQEHLAQLTNDEFSEATSRILTSSVNLVRQQASSVMQMLSEYLNHESELIATKDLLEEFYGAIDDLRQAVDRLAAKVDYYASV